MTLDLVLKYEWYDMIASGEKREEYRDVGTWAHRLIQMYWTTKDCFDKVSKQDLKTFFFDDTRCPAQVVKSCFELGIFRISPYDTVRFHRGYTSTTMDFEIEDIAIGRGKPEWGAPDRETFIIKLGERV